MKDKKVLNNEELEKVTGGWERKYDGDDASRDRVEEMTQVRSKDPTNPGNYYMG